MTRTKYVNKLTDEELKAVFELFFNKACVITKIRREPNQIYVRGLVSGSAYEDDCFLTDYGVGIFRNSLECVRIYRRFMFERFGTEYAENYLINYDLGKI